MHRLERQSGSTYALQEQPGVWKTVGWCIFTNVSDDLVEVHGHAATLAGDIGFNLRITTTPGRILEFNGTVDTAATLSGCTITTRIKAKVMGQTIDIPAALTLTTYDATPIRVTIPYPLRDVFIVTG